MITDPDAVAGVVRVGRESALRDESTDFPVDSARHGTGPDERDREIEGFAGDFFQGVKTGGGLARGNDAADVAPVIAEPGHDVGEHPLAGGDRAIRGRAADVAGARTGDEIGEQWQAPAGTGFERGAELAPDCDLGAAGAHERGQQGLGVVAQCQRGA